MTATDSRPHVDVADGAAEASSELIASTIAGLRRTFASGRTRSYEWRIRQLEGIERLVTEREADIAAALASDLGRSAHEAWLGDVASTVGEAKYARKHLKRWMRKKRSAIPMSVQPGRAFHQYEPLGTVLIIGPWNYPIYLTLSPLVGAVAAGNCVVIKPSEQAPATSALLARLVPEYLDKDAVAVVEGAVSTTTGLIDQALDHILFTGGTEIGRKIMQAAANHLTPVTLELGGKSPVIVTEDANLDSAARRIAWTKSVNSGQTCIAPDYVLVDAKVRDQLVEKIVAANKEFRAGEPEGMPIVNARQFDRISGYLETSGGTVATGGGSDRDGLTIDYTVVVDPDPDSDLMQNEIFGPVLPVLGVTSLDEAIGFVNSRAKPLAAYLFSGSGHTRKRFLAEITAGGSVVNHTFMHVFVPSLAFGGVGNSGMGSYHGKWGFETFSHRKAVVVKPASPDPSLAYPPYTAKKQRIVRKIF
jgi:aldehyde dehydrogenase (NAD+)